MFPDEESDPCEIYFSDYREFDGRWLPGFLCDAVAAAGQPDIGAYGGWRKWLAAQAEGGAPVRAAR